jgi:F-type H+-transporting ATPase subunit b
MKINWFTVIAQIINFFLLVWLLRKFLYKPILDAIDEREKKIVSQIADAEAKKVEANKEQEEFKLKNETFDKEKKDLMDKAIAETNEQRQKLLEDARNDAIALKATQEKALIGMQENLNKEITEKTKKEVFAISRKTLADLASVGLEEQSVNVFLQRLNGLNDDEKNKFNAAFKSNTNAVVVRSAYGLPQKQQDEIQKSVNDLLHADTHIQFETTPELISGIELTANGYKITWSISGYLSSLQKSIAETIQEKQVA